MPNTFGKFFPKLILRAVVCLAFLLLPFHTMDNTNAFAEDSSSREYIYKASFIYNFTKFIQWPKKTYSKIGKTGWNLCLIGKDPFGSILDNTAEKLFQKGKVLNLKREVSLSKISQCSILFISKSEKSRLSKIVAHAKGFPILIIGDTPGYAESGVGINFFNQGSKIRFDINKKAIEVAGLEISSELLELARIVDGKD